MQKLNKYAASISWVSFFLIAVTAVSGCRFIGDIFKAGMAIGIIIVVVILVLIFMIMRMFKRN